MMDLLACEVVELRDAVREVRVELDGSDELRTDEFVAVKQRSAIILADFAEKWLTDKGVSL